MTTPIYGGIDVPADVWGVDTSLAGGLSSAQLDALWNFDLGELKIPGYATHGRPVVLWGYVGFGGQDVRSAWDWTAESIRRACDKGFLCGVVQHCRRGSWLASAANGASDGEAAANFARAIGYPTDCHLAQDDEAVSNPGPDAYANATGWCLAYSQYGKPAIYEGYAPGLTPEQQYQNPYVDRYWGAMGPWDVATRGVCCRQGPTVRNVDGVAFDLDHFFPDKLGGVLRLMGRLDLHQTSQPTA